MGSLLASGISTTAHAATFSEATEVTAASVLSTLAVKGRAPKTGYDRDQLFGDWADPDGRRGARLRDLVRDVHDPPLRCAPGPRPLPTSVAGRSRRRGSAA